VEAHLTMSTLEWTTWLIALEFILATAAYGLALAICDAPIFLQSHDEFHSSQETSCFSHDSHLPNIEVFDIPVRHGTSRLVTLEMRNWSQLAY